MQTLLDRGLVEQMGRAEVIGRPMTYGTTALFLEYFGLRSLEDLPSADELRRIPVTHPETLLTADPGLATAPPEQLALAAVDPSAEQSPPPPVAASPSEQTAPPAAAETPPEQATPPAAVAAEAPPPTPTKPDEHS
jgi:segregation and condensation protein B